MVIAMNEYYGAPTTSTEDFLAHYGVKGMKWGVRKNRINIKRYMTNGLGKHERFDQRLTLRGKIRYGRMQEAKDYKAAVKQTKAFQKEYDANEKKLAKQFRKNPKSVKALARKYVNDIVKNDPDSKDPERRKQLIKNLTEYYNDKDDPSMLIRDANQYAMGKHWQGRAQKAEGNKYRARDKLAGSILRDLNKRGFDIKAASKHGYDELAKESPEFAKRSYPNRNPLDTKKYRNDTVLERWQWYSELNRKSHKKRQK